MRLPARLTRLAARILAPLSRLLLRYADPQDPWERQHRSIRPTMFGSGSQRDFRWYFEGESAVPAASIDDICAWLLECTYLTDAAHLDVADHWQHPRTFEELRRGDCEDHALWAWRKLAELGLDAELVSGRRIVSAVESHDHAWVLFRDGDVEFVLEAVAHTRELMVIPASDVRAQYRPHVGVNARFETTVFGGLLLTAQERQRRSDPGDPQPSYAAQWESGAEAMLDAE